MTSWNTRTHTHTIKNELTNWKQFKERFLQTLLGLVGLQLCKTPKPADSWAWAACTEGKLSCPLGRTFDSSAKSKSLKLAPLLSSVPGRWLWPRFRDSVCCRSDSVRYQQFRDVRSECIPAKFLTPFSSKHTRMNELVPWASRHFPMHSPGRPKKQSPPQVQVLYRSVGVSGTFPRW